MKKTPVNGIKFLEESRKACPICGTASRAFSLSFSFCAFVFMAKPVQSWNGHIQPAAQQQLLLEKYLLFPLPLIAWLICVTKYCNPCNPTALSLVLYWPDRYLLCCCCLCSSLHTGCQLFTREDFPPHSVFVQSWHNWPEASTGYQIKKTNTHEATLVIC